MLRHAGTSLERVENMLLPLDPTFWKVGSRGTSMFWHVQHVPACSACLCMFNTCSRPEKVFEHVLNMQNTPYNFWTCFKHAEHAWTCKFCVGHMLLILQSNSCFVFVQLMFRSCSYYVYHVHFLQSCFSMFRNSCSCSSMCQKKSPSAKTECSVAGIEHPRIRTGNRRTNHST